MSKTFDHGPRRPSPQPPRIAIAGRINQGLFLTFLTLVLVFPSVTSGPFTQLPVVQLGDIEGAPLSLGPLSLLPALALIAWCVVRVIERPRRPWRWGRRGITLPLAGMTLLMLLGLDPTVTHRTLVVLLSLGLLWWIYFFVANEAPNVMLPLTVAIIIHSVVAVGQFALQRDIGLNALGEPTLDPLASGTCVLFARGQRWLRAYGLSGHPNLLGALLSVLMLLIIDAVAEADHQRRAWFTFVASAGLLALLTTFSRSAWLAFGVGVLGWLLRRIIWRRRGAASWMRNLLDNPVMALRRNVQFLAPVVLALLFLVLHHDLVASRFLHLETPIEARSVTDRQVDASLALRLIRQHPWRGVGVQNYLVAVRAIETDSRTVHNILLLTAAELGLPGALLWLWLAVSGATCVGSPAWAPWLAMLVTGLFDVALFPTNSWHAAAVFGILTGHMALPLAGQRLPDAADQVGPAKDRPHAG